ncbi:MAG: alpha-galactosidase [Anaerolineales bacterium]|nr:alpha-galactosidase [Anaerolineales bacterium]
MNMISLKNPSLLFRLDPETGVWGLAEARENSMALEGARIGAAFRDGKSRVEWLLGESPGAPVPGMRNDFHHGRCWTLAVESEAGSGLRVRVEWSLPAKRPFLLWRAVLTNAGSRTLHIDRIDLCHAGGRSGIGGGVRLTAAPVERTMFVNGWQSWSYAGGRRAADRQPGPKLGPINAAMHIGAHRRTTGRPGHFVSDMFTAIGGAAGGDLLVAGFLAQREQFGLVETWLGDEILSLRIEADADGVRLDPGCALGTDYAYLSLGAPAGEYFDAAARENEARTRRAAPAGWSSWYYYFTAIDQKNLERNTDAAAELRPKLPLRLIQLDDGYQADAGVWLERNFKFPSRMDEISARIQKAGFTPGVWMSPFLTEAGSKVARDHPDWLAPRAEGVMSNVKLAWVRETRSLDVTRPEVLTHIRRLIRTAVKEWKYPFLKLDYLYLPAVKGARLADPAVTRAQALRKALEEIRAAAGEKAYLLGCGCPLGSGIGIFDAMRIGPDVDSIWKPHLFHHTWAGLGDPTLPSAWNSVRNMLARAPLHRRWWWNDPDCLLARDRETRLTIAERRSLAAAIALSGGMVLLSDDLAALSWGAVRLAQSLFPPVYRAADLPAWRGEAPSSIAVLPMRGASGKWWVIGVFNWKDRPAGRIINIRELTGISGEPVVFSFWDERTLITADGRLHFSNIPPHGSVLLAVRPPASGIRLIGSNLHFTQGAEVAKWKTSRGSLRAVLRLGREAEGALWISLPGDPLRVWVDGVPVRPENAGAGIWKIPVRFAGDGIVDINWNSGGRRR